MSRWIVVAVVAIIALAAGAGLSQLRANIAQDRQGQAASAGTAPGSDDELVTRLLTPTYSPTGKEQSVTLVRGALPADPKLDAPSPTGSRLIGSIVRSSGGVASNIQVLFDVPGTASDVVAFYDRELAALGWKPMADRGMSQGGGFQPSMPALNKLYCKTETVPWLSVTVASKEKSPNDVRLSYQLQNEGFGSSGPCSPQAFGPQPFASRIPALRAPSDVQFRGGSGTSGGSDRQSSETSALTSRRAADLESYFSAQLAGAGWSRSDGGASGPIAWSTWKVPGDGNWTGLLLILETGTDTRLLSVRAEAPPPK
jgi:hypothetical protein